MITFQVLEILKEMNLGVVTSRILMCNVLLKGVTPEEKEYQLTLSEGESSKIQVHILMHSNL